MIFGGKINLNARFGATGLALTLFFAGPALASAQSHTGGTQAPDSAATQSGKISFPYDPSVGNIGAFFRFTEVGGSTFKVRTRVTGTTARPVQSLCLKARLQRWTESSWHRFGKRRRSCYQKVGTTHVYWRRTKGWIVPAQHAKWRIEVEATLTISHASSVAFASQRFAT